MTENKMTTEIALHCMKAQICEELCEECQCYGTTGTDHCEEDAIRMAISAIEEIQQYWAIENDLREKYNANVDIKGLIEYFIETIFKGDKHEGFCILINEDAKMWDEYQAIGTLDQCREAVERMKPKKPKNVEAMEDLAQTYFVECHCGGMNHTDIKHNHQVIYCWKCGQAIDNILE